MASEVKDKYAVLQVVGCLMKKPVLLLDDEHPLNESDFPERFHRIVFGAIDYLAKNGAQSITFATVDNFLERYTEQYRIFNENHGVEYLENAYQLSDLNNYELYYDKVRKLSLLSKLSEHGFDTSLIYNTNLVKPNEVAEMQRRFDNYSVSDILDAYQKEIASLQKEYSISLGSVGAQAGHGLREQKEQYKEVPEMGMPLNSPMLTTILRGRRPKKLYIRTAPTGYGKTRYSVADAARVSVPCIYDPQTLSWITTGCQEPTLYITTELELEEIQSILVAYVAAVPEQHYLSGQYSQGEEARVDEAISILEQAPLYIEQISNFDVDDIERIIKEHKLSHQIGYVFFDYIFLSNKILAEAGGKSGGVKIREDNVLVMFGDRMKALANTLNLHIDTSTQANGDWKNTKNADQNVIRGAKGLADKADVALVMLPVTEEDKTMLAELLQNGMWREPNLVMNIYKVRRGQTNHVKLWIYFDYGTCRTTDCFVTTNDYKLVDIESTNIELITDDYASQDLEF